MLKRNLEEIKYLDLPFTLEFDNIESSSIISEEDKIFSQLSNPFVTIKVNIGTEPQILRMKINSTKFYMFYYNAKLNNNRINYYRYFFLSFFGLHYYS